MKPVKRRLILLAGLAGLALSCAAPAGAAEKQLTILATMPDMAFPFFTHMMAQVKSEAAKIGAVDIIEADGQRSSPKQTADIEAAITKGVDGMFLDPNEVDALAPADRKSHV